MKTSKSRMAPPAIDRSSRSALGAGLLALALLTACSAPPQPSPPASQAYAPLPPAQTDDDVPRAIPARPEPTENKPSTPTPTPVPTPTRPARPAPAPAPTGAVGATTLINGTAYVDAAPYLAAFGLKAQSTAGNRSVIFRGEGHVFELEAEDRETKLDGLRLYLGDPVQFRANKFYVSRIDAQKLIAPLLNPSAIAGAPRPAPRSIVIDPGHGGGDPGTENKVLGLSEKELALDVAKRLKTILEARGWRVILTRTADRELSNKKETDLAQRAAMANRERADLFLSIHFNSVAPDTRTSGTEVYWFAPQFQRSATSWAAGQKADDEDTPSSVNRYDAWSALLANHLHRTMLSELGTVDRGQKIKHLAVLRPLDCPGVLVECAFLSNDAEARKAGTPAFRQKIAESIASGLTAYGEQLKGLQKP